jgi:hypothetical protein
MPVRSAIAALIPAVALLGCGGTLDADSAGDDGALAEDAAPGDDAPVIGEPVTLAIDATRGGFAIPEDFVGISFSRDYISGNGTIQRLFDKASNHHYDHLVNLFRQIGIKHIRTVSGTADADQPDPSAADDELLFQFAHEAGFAEHSIIYSLHLFREDPRGSQPPGTNNVTAAQHIWNSSLGRPLLEAFALDNESDWHYHYAGLDPRIDGYGDYRDEWTYLHQLIQDGLGNPTPPAPFAGPDTGSSYPVKTDPTSDTSIAGVPFTLRFAMDQRARIGLATQHFYGGSNTKPVTWAPGVYRAGDIVADPKHGYVTYRSRVDNPSSKTHPDAAPTYWQKYPRGWSATASYQVGDDVQDAAAPARIYRCKKATSARSLHPSSDPEYWERDDTFPLLSGYQMATQMLSAAWLDDYQTLLDRALASAAGWPTGLRFRMTEANSFSGGRDEASHIFATALWALDYFHWWAQHGCVGIDPFTRVVQYNAAIFQTSDGDFLAPPYAYGMKAFSLGSRGTSIDPSGISFSSALPWLTGYAVLGADHLYVTLVNKSFTQVEPHDAAVTLAAPDGFAARQARYLVLASTAGDAPSDALERGATLGGALLPTTGEWQGTWKSAAVHADGSIGPLPVGAASAIVVELTRQ